MGFLDEIGQYLEDQGVGTQGSDIFLGLLPERQPNNGFSIREMPGVDPEYLHDDSFEGAAIQKPGAQLIFRNESYVNGRDQAESAWLALGKINRQTILGTYYIFVKPSQSPFLMDIDADGRFLIAFSIDVEKGVSV